MDGDRTGHALQFDRSCRPGEHNVGERYNLPLGGKHFAASLTASSGSERSANEVKPRRSQNSTVISARWLCSIEVPPDLRRHAGFGVENTA
ncbi:MAG: hypothetical protein LH616_17025 [Ilumatobacteraceae bacterium]|nr:hypothetical protein [Ilumatobacteraceae bacterium]